ncbi:MAG TPA: TPM domain-containing protein [Verrucomicrobiae bacterium]|jgi:uncharacterized membrane protein|nr:TPM domain-containing protein [Verrucomicrobiae bacterium]
MQAKDFLDALDDDVVVKAIADAEKRTSGEIRVFVTHKPVKDAVLAARQHFLELGMTKTEARNGVLIFFAPKSRSFAVIGDKGVHEKCGQHFWEHVTGKMTPLLKEGKFAEAVVLAVKEIGEVLAKEFPWKAGDRNELPNQVARDKDK